MTPEQRSRLASWTYIWYTAANLAAESVSGSGVGMSNAPLLLFVDSMRNVIRGAERLLGRDHPALRDFRAAVPDAVNVRDVVGHFDAYALGKGALQKKGLIRGDIAHFVSGRIDNEVRRIHVADFVVELPGALEALADLAQAALDSASITEVSETP